MKTKTLAQVEALINLLDDSDQEVYQHVEEELRSYGPAVVSTLIEAFDYSSDPIRLKRLDSLIHRIRFKSVFQEVEEWKSHGGLRLFKALTALGMYRFPNLKEEDINLQLHKLKQDIWLEFHYDLTPLEETHVFNQILFKHHGFKGKNSLIKKPNSYFLPELLLTREGNPHSIGLLYLSLAQMLNMPVMGVCLPYYLILARLSFEPEDLREVTEKDILYYIDPFNNGAIFSKNEISNFLKKSNIKTHPSYFLPSDNVRVLAETLKSVQQLYGDRGSDREVDDMDALLNILEGPQEKPEESKPEEN